MSIEKLHTSAWKGVFHVTGGGSGIVDAVLSKPGASGTVLEAIVPYSERSLAQVLGFKPSHACSEETARALAMCAFQRARQLTNSQSISNLFGFAVTASLRTTQTKKGRHRAYIALQTLQQSTVLEIGFIKNQQSRSEEERQLTQIALNELFNGLGIEQSGSEHSRQTFFAPEPWQALLADQRNVVGQQSQAFLPGSFNPLHDGHTEMRTIAEQILATKVQYELSITNVDKPPLDYLEIESRTKQFEPNDIVLTNLPRFLDKARHLAHQGNCTFVVGMDTLDRVAESRYYESESTIERDAALQEMQSLGVRFLVFGRLIENSFKSLKDLHLPESLLALCSEVDAVRFRNDISSTALRSQMSSKSPDSD